MLSKISFSLFLLCQELPVVTFVVPYISRVVLEHAQKYTINPLVKLQWHISDSSRKPYKEWTISELLTFRYPFSIGNTEYRILFVKVKNSIYIEFHLGDHKYYDKVRKDLDLKKSSY